MAPDGADIHDKPASEFEEGDPKASTTLVAAVVGALIVLVLSIAVQAYFYNAEEAEHARKVISAVPQDLARLRAEQQEQLATYRWVDQRSGLVQIPIDRAMELTVRDQGALPALPAAARQAAAAPSAETSPEAGAQSPSAPH